MSFAIQYFLGGGNNVSFLEKLILGNLANFIL